nr:immunoglobulin heavy chain junction region [Mus musculus]MBK4196218.1 immunoglobulin heavy chain junction region [Mus musculus]
CAREGAYYSKRDYFDYW